jgi:hypothetical protein
MNRILASTVLCGVFALAGCGNSTTNSDAGVDTGANYGGGPADANEEGAEGDSGDAADSQPVCVIPASANTPPLTDGGPGCEPNRGAPFNCPDLSTSFKLVCLADIPSNIPPPPSSLGCGLAPNVTSETAVLFYCCPCGK